MSIRGGQARATHQSCFDERPARATHGSHGDCGCEANKVAFPDAPLGSLHDVGGCDANRAALRTPRPGVIESATEAAMTATSAEGTPTGLLTKATSWATHGSRAPAPLEKVARRKFQGIAETGGERAKRSVREPLELDELKRERHLGCVRTYIPVAFNIEKHGNLRAALWKLAISEGDNFKLAKSQGDTFKLAISRGDTSTWQYLGATHSN
mmetsp:Transcript_24096/g.63680  ORF Transcript_24096/g.63680 Transcript_24096/m.63680 type:complete len:211 (+) Transcript_24096:2374-3006(+)